MTGTTSWQESLNLLVRTRQCTLDLVDGLSQERLDYSPSSGAWSLGEILDHLVLAEKLYRDEIAELVTLQKAGKEARIRRSVRDLDVTLFFLPKAVLPYLAMPLTVFNLFVPTSLRELMTRSPVIPAKNPAIARPQKGKSGESLRQELESSLRETENLFGSNPDLDYSAMVHDHPMLGVNDVPHLLRIAALHEQRHQVQIRRLLAR